MRIHPRFLASIALAVCVLPAAQAQEARATLKGRVTDAQGGAIPRATVVVTSAETNVKLTVRTNNAGEWNVPGLVVGHYSFTVTAPGFATLEHTPVELQVGDIKTIDEQLSVGGQNEVVTVESATPLIDTTAATGGTVVTTKQLEELPSQTNSPTLLAGLTPGVTVGGTTGTAAHLWSNISDSALTVNGSGSGTRAVNYVLDGGTDTNQAGQISFVPPSDAVSEFRVTTDAYDASIGRAAAGTINLQFKSGTKDIHGSLYEFNQNNFLNARTYNPTGVVSPGAPVVHYNEYGLTVGGPVYLPKLYSGRKKQTFFFFSFDKIHNTAPGNTGYISLPTTLEKAGDFSHSFTTVTTGSAAAGTLSTTVYPVRVYNPGSYNASTGLRTEFAGNNCSVAPVVVPGGIPAGTDPNTYLASRTCSVPVQNPIAKFIGSQIPDRSPTANDGSNSDSNNYFKNDTYFDYFTSYAGRFDQTWNDRHRSYATLKYNTWHELGYDAFGPTNLLQGLNQKRINEGVLLDHTWLISSSLLADLRFNVSRYEGSSGNTSAGVSPVQYGLSSTFAAQQQLPSLPYLSGLVGGSVENGGLGTNQFGPTYDTNWEYLANMTKTAGPHNIRFGVQWLAQQEAVAAYGSTGGSFGFDSTWDRQNPTGSAGTGEGSAYAAFLLGLPTNGSLPTNGQFFYSQHYFGTYVQDDWRVTERFTLDLGLRWDVEFPLSERHNKMWARYDPNYVQTAITASAQPRYATVYKGPASSTGAALVQAYGASPSSFIAKGGYEYAGVNGAPDTILNTRLKYFQPRVGFAYKFTPNTVLRGGVGRFVQGTFDTGVGAQTYGYSVSTPLVDTTDGYRTVAQGYSFANPFYQGLNPVTGNTLGAQTNAGNVTGYRDPNYGRPYTDTGSLTLQQQIRNFLVEYTGTLNVTHGLSVADPLNGNSNGFQVNQPSQAAWLAAYGASFTNGRPDDTLPGNVLVSNPFLGAPYITNGSQTSTNVAAAQLLNPNPIRGNIIEDSAKGKNYYYALQTKVERRYQNGFSLLQSFTWAKDMSENNFIGPQGYAEVIERRLSSSDIKFHYTLTPLYILPFGRGRAFGSHVGKAADLAIGGWELTGIYNFQSGTPVVLPTNTAFFIGSDPSAGAVRGRGGVWFNPNSFRAYPTRNTTVAQLQQNYPGWTGIQALPGYNYVPSATDTTRNGVYQDFTTRVTYNQTTFGDIRQPFTTVFTLGIRKNFYITETVRAELRMDAFNALNHPQFGDIGTDPTSAYFGRLSGAALPNAVNNPRQIQLSAKVYF